MGDFTDENLIDDSALDARDHIDADAVADLLIATIDTAVDEWRALMRWFHCAAVREHEVPMFRGSRLWGGQTGLTRAQLVVDLEKFFAPGGDMDTMIDFLRSLGIRTPGGNTYRAYIERITTNTTQRKKMVPFWTRLKQFPPVLCRLIARVEVQPNVYRPKTTHEIARDGGIPVRDVLVLAQSPTWDGTPIETLHGYMIGCGFDFSDGESMEKLRLYVKSGPKFSHLKRTGQFKSYWIPLVRIYYQALRDGQAIPVFVKKGKHINQAEAIDTDERKEIEDGGEG